MMEILISSLPLVCINVQNDVCMKLGNSKMLLILIICIVVGLRHTACVFGATLPEDEVKALGDIAKSIGKTEWNLKVDPCANDGVTCNDYSHGWHVTGIRVDDQGLQGKPPPEIVRLPFLQDIHLNNNYLNGTLPPEWGSMQHLINISLTGNRITGSIPREFGNLSTLQILAFEYNQLSGSIPPELENLKSIQNILLTSNYLNGTLPTTLGNLKTLKEFKIGDNTFSGNIPNYIQSWESLEKLYIQGSGLNGPIPSAISALVNLTDLRISDLSGPDGPFPPLNYTKTLKIIILRSCNIIGALPDYFGEMTALTTLDLSFNKLSGEIPAYFKNLANVNYIYLTGNMLTGPVHVDWFNTQKKSDLSYNKFTFNSSGTCPPHNVNLFRSFLSNSNSSGPCWENSNCLKKYHSVHINCGGKKERVGGDGLYEDDSQLDGPSGFGPTWAFSNTGHFMDPSPTTQSNNYIFTSPTKLSVKNSQLYTNARLSPISVTYYGLCLENGKYTVKLHFAEIMFTDDKKISSLGRRIFDIFIQGKRVEKDLNIAAEAGGVGKALVKNYSANVTSHTLEIRLYWAGKGTTGIPENGVYGPLISAISFGMSNTDQKRFALEMAGAVVCGILLVLGLLWWKRNTRSQGQQSRSFTLAQLEAATNNFLDDNRIGEGGFGPVYKGILSDGTTIAVKQLSSKSKQGNREFLNEIGIISALQHPHLVTLYGCCTQGNQLLLVYEYLENNNLANALYGHEEKQLKLDWPTRHKICVGIAKGLAYLHEESRLKIVHRDIKPANILLDKDLNAKISDFGLAKLDVEEDTHISTRVAGTYGYMAPEYAMRGHLTDKADVYSFGVVALEIVCGKRSICHQKERFSILEWANILEEKGDVVELVDSRLGTEYNREQVMDMVKVGLLCTNKSAAVRPSMSSVVSMLEGTADIPDSRNDFNSERKFLAMKTHFEQLNMSECTSDSQYTIGGPSATSSSHADLYPIHSSCVDIRVNKYSNINLSSSSSHC